MDISYSGYDGGNETVEISEVTLLTLPFGLMAINQAPQILSILGGIKPEYSAVAVPNRQVFDQLSSRSDVPGA